MNCLIDCPLYDECDSCEDCQYRFANNDMLCAECCQPGTNNPCHIKPIEIEKIK